MKKIIILISLVFLIAIPAQAENSIRNENQTTLYTTEADTGPMQSVDRFGNLQCSLRAGTASATNPIKLEDSAHTTGDAGVQMLGVANTGFASLAANGDYLPPALTTSGVTMSGLFYDAIGDTREAITREDVAIAADSAMVKTAAQAVSAIAQTVGTSGDAAPPSMDLGNRLVTTNAPSGEMLQGCNVAVTTATTGTIVNAVASKFNFMTGFTCTNTGATATRVIIEDGDGVDMATLFLPATSGYATATFPSPGIRTNVVNRSLQVNVITTGSSTICCVSGFVGVI